MLPSICTHFVFKITSRAFLLDSVLSALRNGCQINLIFVISVGREKGKATKKVSKFTASISGSMTEGSFLLEFEVVMLDRSNTLKMHFDLHAFYVTLHSRSALHTEFSACVILTPIFL